MTFPLPGSNYSFLHTFTLKATTGLAGVQLTDGTPTLLTWDVPDDGQLHRFTLSAAMDVISNTTGGTITVSFTLPDGTSSLVDWIAGTQGFPGYNFGIENVGITPVQPGSTVTVAQQALTAGAATVWVEIWGH